MTDIATLPILVRRRIEAEFAKGVFEEMKAEIGETAARRILASAVIKMAKRQAAEMAASMPDGGSLNDFRAIQPRWTAEDALHIETVKSTDTEEHFDVTRCRYVEMYRAMGIADLGALLSCNRDAAFSEGFSPDLELTRTQTILGGATHCDFRYRVKPSPKGPAGGTAP